VWRSIRVKLVLVYLLLILFALQLVGAYFVRTLNASLLRGETTSIEHQAQLLATLVAPSVASSVNPGTQDLSSLLSSFPQPLSGVVYILNDKGVVEATSAGAALVGQKRIDSIATQALVGKTKSVGVRLDPQSGNHVLAVAMPITYQHKFVGIVEDVVPIQNTYATVKQVTTIFYTTSAIVLIITVLLSIILSQAISRPVIEVTKQARGMADGDFSHRVEVRNQDELGDLGRAVNDLADHLEAALSENLRERERLHAVITYMGDGVITFDDIGVPVFANGAAYRLLPGGEAALAQAAQLLDVKKRIAAGREENFVHSLEDKLLHIHLTAIRRQGVINGYVAVIRDVTEQERLNEARRDFVANVSHELRTPLTSIKSYLEALEDGGLDEETKQSFLKVCAQETDRMVRITQDLLHLSGLEQRQSIFVERKIYVRDWLKDAVQRFQLPAKDQHVDMELECEGEPVIAGDRDLLDRLLDNLLSNALKYTPANGKITVFARTLEQEVEVLVHDTGMGIPETDLAHVFQRFYRVDKARSRRRGGTGLGLAIAREITERHHGDIRIESQLNEGTTVIVRLPRREEENQ
jgi:two-component system, OmpR family, sensor histidine kinase VicK